MKTMKHICLVLALVLALSMGAAFAEADAPSPDLSGNIVVIEDATSTSTGVDLPEEFIAAIQQPSEATPEQTAVVEAEQAAISAFVEDGQRPIIEYFPTDVQDAVVAQLPVDAEGAPTVAPETLVLRELFPYAVNALAPMYSEEYGDVTTTFSFPVEFEADGTAVAMMGILPAAEEAVEETAEPDMENVTWVVLPTAVTEDGMLEITFTPEAFAQVGENDTTFIAVLSA